jgi:hypothetical protein
VARGVVDVEDYSDVPPPEPQPEPTPAPVPPEAGAPPAPALGGGDAAPQERSGRTVRVRAGKRYVARPG